MRRPLLFLFCLLAAPNVASALELRGVSVRGGAARISTDMQFEGAELISVDAIVEPMVGVALRWRNSPRSRFELLTEFGYLRGGYELRGREYHASLLQIPLLLRSDLGGARASVYFVFGPSVGIVVDRDGGIIDRYRTLSLAGQAGLGVIRRVNRDLKLYGEFRFSGDLTNLYSPVGDEDSLESVRQRVLQLSIGIEF